MVAIGMFGSMIDLRQCILVDENELFIEFKEAVYHLYFYDRLQTRG